MSNIYSTSPANNGTVYSGQIVQQTINITSDTADISNNSFVKISNLINMEVGLSPIDGEAGSYNVPVIPNIDNSKEGSAVFYYTINANAKVNTGFRFQYQADPVQVIVNPIAPAILPLNQTSDLNSTEYLFTVSDNTPDPINNSENTAVYTITVMDSNEIPVNDYDIYWYDSVETGIFAKSNIYVSDAVAGTYTQLQPIPFLPGLSPINSPIFHTKTNIDGNATLYITGKNEAIYGAPKVTGSTKTGGTILLGTITIYDPQNSSLFIQEPNIINAAYNGSFLNLDAMADPIQTSVNNYRNATGTDTVTLVVNGIPVDKNSYNNLNGTSKTLNLYKTSLNVSTSATQKIYNNLLYVIASSDGTVRTSMINNFAALGSNLGKNEPVSGVIRYPYEAVIPSISGIYITADDIHGGVPVNYPFLNPNFTPNEGDILVATYYLNGFRAGTTTPRQNKIVRPPHTITSQDIKNGFYQDILSPDELQGYSKSQTGEYRKLFIDYTIKFVNNGNFITYFDVNQQYFLSTVAPGAFQ